MTKENTDKPEKQAELPQKLFYYGFAIVVPKSSIPDEYIEEITKEMKFISHKETLTEFDVLIPKKNLDKYKSVNERVDTCKGIYQPPQIRQWRLFHQDHGKIINYIDSFFKKPKVDPIIIFHTEE